MVITWIEFSITVSWQRFSKKSFDVCITLPLSATTGNSFLPGNPSTDDAVRDHLAELEKALLEDESWGDFDFNEAWANPYSAVEHSTGLSSVNGAHNNNINHGGLSAASEAGSVSYGGLSPPVSEVGSRRYMGYSPSPASKPWSCRFRGL